jgi:hypothetical protein
MLGIALAILIVPFAVFLFCWRSSAKDKTTLGGAYLVALLLGISAAFSVDFSSEWAFISVLFGIPFGVWLIGVLWLRARARGD